MNQVGYLLVLYHELILHPLRFVSTFSVEMNPSKSVHCLCFIREYMWYLQDDPQLHDNNVQERVQAFIDASHNQVRIFGHRDI
jgi:hypothetical protein